MKKKLSPFDPFYRTKEDRCFDILRWCCFKNSEEIAKRSKRDLLTVKGIGPKSLEVIIKRLEKNGFKLATENRYEKYPKKLAPGIIAAIDSQAEKARIRESGKMLRPIQKEPYGRAVQVGDNPKLNSRLPGARRRCQTAEPK